MMKMAILLLTFVLAACGETGKIESVVKERLNDPDSAKFKEHVVSNDGERACIVWNAKNRMGGYGSWKIAELQKIGGKWTASDIEGEESNCTPECRRAFKTTQLCALNFTQGL